MILVISRQVFKGYVCRIVYNLFSVFMNNTSAHSFHIPVMGLAFTIDTPVKVAHFGISSAISIIDDKLAEEMRKYYCQKRGEIYLPITDQEMDSRALRITAYLNLLNTIVLEQFNTLCAEAFTSGNDIVKYFELLPPSSNLRLKYEHMYALEPGVAKTAMQAELRKEISCGAIDVNIMTKCDKTNFTKNGEALPPEYADAMAALRGFANSSLSSSVIFSAGMNPRLFSYCASFPEFFPNDEGWLKKKIILKVSDFRSAQVQGKMLAKKGLWVSEFRIESGLNCGGHAFATDGYLLGPILEEFKNKKQALVEELLVICNEAIAQKGGHLFKQIPEAKLSVQGGIGTANENSFLLEYYQVNSTGWGSPFLLVPEATNVDEVTLAQLAAAKKEDYYLSNASPLGVLFNNFRNSSGDKDRAQRIEKGRPGSPCYNKYLSFNTEFTEKPICTASREYQHLKIKQLNEKGLPEAQLANEIKKVTEKECICHGLGNSVFLKHKTAVPHGLGAVSICPGPNLAYFSKIFSMREMIDHIYGRKNMLNTVQRPSFFINELTLYVDYLKNEITKNIDAYTAKQEKQLQNFRTNLLSGIAYYKSLAKAMVKESEQYRNRFNEALIEFEMALLQLELSPAAGK